MSIFSAAWTLAQKDLRSFVRDRMAMLLSILVPIMLVTIFGWIMAYAFGGSGGMPKVSLHVADLDQSTASQDLVAALTGLDMIRLQEVKLDPDNLRPVNERLTEMIKAGDAHHILIISQGYAAQVSGGQTPTLSMLRDPGRKMEDQVVQISIMQAAMSELGGSVWVEAMDRMLSEQGMDRQQLALIRGWMSSIGDTIGNFSDQKNAQTEEGANSIEPEDSVAKTATEDDALSPPEQMSPKEEAGGFDANAMLSFMSNVVPMDTTDVAPPNRSQQVTYQQAQSVAGMTVMMLLFALTSCASVLLVERDAGTLKRLYIQPIPRNTVLLGKLLFVLIVGIVQMSILFCYGEWMFRVGLFRDPVTLVVLSLTWVATGGAFGMFLATVSQSQKQAESLASLLILMMAALGGCWFPLQLMNLPTLLETLCKSTMTYWAMTGFQGMLWNQLPWYSKPSLVALGWQWGWALSLGALAVVFYRRNYCRG